MPRGATGRHGNGLRQDATATGLLGDRSLPLRGRVDVISCKRAWGRGVMVKI